MSLLQIESFAAGRWVKPGDGARPIENAVTGAPMAMAGNDALDVEAMLAHARAVGGLALRALTFHDRARMLKALAQALDARKQALYDLSYATGATLADHKIDIDGGIGTLFVYASKGRREMPDAQVYIDGEVEQLSRGGTFLGRTSARRCRASRCISTPSTSRSGGCWKSSPRPCWPGCPRSSSRRPRPAT